MNDAHDVWANLTPVRTTIWHGKGPQTDIGAAIFNNGAHPILNVRGEVRTEAGYVKHRLDTEKIEANSYLPRQWLKEPEDEATTFEYSPRRPFSVFMTVTFCDVLGNQWRTDSDRGSPCVLVRANRIVWLLLKTGLRKEEERYRNEDLRDDALQADSGTDSLR
jgi:hypothetical protein